MFSENTTGVKLTAMLGPVKTPSKNAFPHNVAAILSTSKMNPNFPMPPKRPSVGTSLQGPCRRNPAIPLEADKTELVNAVKKKASSDVMYSRARNSLEF